MKRIQRLGTAAVALAAAAMLAAACSSSGSGSATSGAPATSGTAASPSAAGSSGAGAQTSAASQGGTASSGAASQGSGGSASGTLNVYLYQAPKLFSPLEPNNGPDQIVMTLVFDSLLKADTNYQLQPRLAAAMPKISADATTFTFTLRKGLKWSDGQPFTSKDVLFTYNLLANINTTSAQAGNFSMVQGYDQVKSGKATTLSGFSAPDDYTFVIKTTQPDIGLLSIVSQYAILPQHVLGKDAIDKVASDAFFNHPTVGLGPYNFVTYKTDQYVELKQNPNFRTPAHIGTIYLKPVTSDVATSQLGTGEMDLVQISPTDLPTVQGMSNVKTVTKQSPGYIRIAINQTKAQFKDPRVRQAMLYAIDRKKIVQSVLDGQGSVVNTTMMGDAMGTNLNDYAYNPDKARQLLAAAGWNPNTTVTLAWIPGQRDRDTSATVVQSQLEAVGMKVKLKQVQADELVKSYTDLSFDMALYGGGSYAVDPWSAYPILACDQGYPDGANLPHFCDPNFDKLMKQANSTADQAQRTKLYQQASDLENKDAAYLWLYNPNTIWAYNTRLQGFAPSGDITAPFYNIQDWTLSS